MLNQNLTRSMLSTRSFWKKKNTPKYCK